LVSALKTQEDLESDVELEEQGHRRPEHGNHLHCPRAVPSRSPSEPETAYYTLYNWVDGLPPASPSLFPGFYQGYHEYPPDTEYSRDSGYSPDSEDSREDSQDSGYSEGSEYSGESKSSQEYEYSQESEDSESIYPESASTLVASGADSSDYV
jgi:hypothetical protein